MIERQLIAGKPTVAAVGQEGGAEARRELSEVWEAGVWVVVWLQRGWLWVEMH